MTSRDIIQKILLENPQLSEEQLLERLSNERKRTGGLLGDETLLRLIAAKCGVTVEQNGICSSGVLATCRLFAGLNDVTVEGRVIAVFPARSFEGEKPGKYATAWLADNDGTLRIMLWNEKAELVESAFLKVGQVARFVHGYTREDRNGKVELHVGGRSSVEVEPPEKANAYPTIERFLTKIGALTASTGAVHVRGVVKDVFEPKTFTRSDSTDGSVMRFTLVDDSGMVTTVAWNDKAIELKTSLKPGVRLQLINARVKDTQNGALEIHVDQNTYAKMEGTSSNG